MQCPDCQRAVERRFRFCPWCAAPLRLKLTELFAGDARFDSGRALRVSRYVADGHVRVSVWGGRGAAEAALSIDELEAARLARFLAPPRRRASVLEWLRGETGAVPAPGPAAEGSEATTEW